MVKRDLSMIALVFFLSRCFFNTYTFYNLYSFLISSFIILILLIVMKKIKKDLFQSKLIKGIYILILLFLFITILINATKFINTNYFRYDNYFVVGLSLIVISYIIGKDQIKTIGSISEIFLFIFILVTLISSVGLISLIDVTNYGPFIKFQNITFHLFPGFLVFILFYLKENNIIMGYLLGSISYFFDTILLVGCLGTKLILRYRFPGIAILKSLNLFHFINHLDKLLSFVYLFEYTSTLALIMYIIIHLIKSKNLNSLESQL